MILLVDTTHISNWRFLMLLLRLLFVSHALLLLCANSCALEQAYLTDAYGVCHPIY